MPAGRPVTYSDDIPEKLLKHFDVDLRRSITKRFVNKKGDVQEWEEEIANDFPTLAGFFWKHDICKKTFHNWLNSGNYPELLHAYSQIKERQEEFLVTHGLLGTYNSAYAKFLTTNLTEYKDKSETDHKSSDGSMTPVYNFMEQK